jgi:hypothetical protein
MWSADEEREPVPVPRDAERSVPTTRRKVAGTTERREISGLVRAMKSLAKVAAS